MSYYTGMLAAVPTANKQAYIDHAKAAWPIFRDLGATRTVESWGVNVQKGKVTDLLAAVQAKDDESVVYTWIEWPDRATADAAWGKMMSGEAGQEMGEMPFDGSRMIFGGFEPIYEQGALGDAGYVQGFLAAVPEANRDAYVKMADETWPIFERLGCVANVETWGVDVHRGEKTDMYRATKAEDGEAIIFSWNAWPDRATCDNAAEQMMEEMKDFDPSDMPFDGMRMMWGGFEKVFDSADPA